MERYASLRALFGALAPIAVVPADGSPTVACPGRDLMVHPGDRITVLGTSDELRAAQLVGRGTRRRRRGPTPAHPRPGRPRPAHRHGGRLGRQQHLPRRPGRRPGAGRRVDGHPPARPTGARGRPHDPSWPLYFTVETISTVGFGDYSFAAPVVRSRGLRDPPHRRPGAMLLTTVFALITNVLVSWRIQQSLGRQQLVGTEGPRGRHRPRLGGHPGARGPAGRGSSRWWWSSATRTTGSSTRPGPSAPRCSSPTRPSARPWRTPTWTRRSAVAVLTSDDLTNIETGLAVRDYLGRPLVERAGGAPGVRPRPRPHRRAPLRLPPRAVHLGAGRAAVRRRRPRPRHPRVLHRRPASRSWWPADAWLPGGASTGWPWSDLPAQTRVVALSRAADGGRLEHPPRRGTRFAPGDQAYLLGPYEELLRVLRHQHDGDVGSAG